MDGFAVTFCLMGSPVSATRMEHYGLTGGFVEVCKIVYCLKAAIQEHPVVVAGIGMDFKKVHTPNCCTTLLVELPSPTHAQAVEFKRILPVPNRHGSPLFFENREQKRIEPTRKPQLIRLARGRVAQAETARSPRGLGISQT